MGQKPRQAPQHIPDSLPKLDESPDVSTDNVRRNERPVTVPPDSLPREEDETLLDGGVAEHPMHDSDQEDRDPTDFERDIDQDGARPVDTVIRRQS